MAIGDLDSGARFGLPPIGLPQAHLDTPGSDTERRPMPGLATKSSVFAWVGTPITIISIVGQTGQPNTNTINLRNNTATGGSSLDVPTWAAGVYLQLDYTVATMGTSNFHRWTISCPVVGGTVYLFSTQKQAVLFGPGVSETISVIVPFYDEPVVTINYSTDGSGTGTYSSRVVGFVRNV